MKNLLDFGAKICQTASGVLIHQGKVLLIKHRKLGTWLCPGGHLDAGEEHFQAAEREFFEETGLKVQAYTPKSLLLQLEDETAAQFLPTPFNSNIHWISKQNYQARLAGEQSNDQLWSKGCEQHLNFSFLVRPAGDLNFKQNTEETDGIAWFSQAEFLALGEEEIFPDIKAEISLAFKLV